MLANLFLVFLPEQVNDLILQALSFSGIISQALIVILDRASSSRLEVAATVRSHFHPLVVVREDEPKQVLSRVEDVRQLSENVSKLIEISSFFLDEVLGE